jgi:hypothetical protein
LKISSLAQGGSEIETIRFDSRWKAASKGWGYSFSLWVKIDQDTCTASRPSDALKNCFLVYLRNSFMLYLLPDKNQVVLYFFAEKPIFESVSKSLFVP